MNSKWIFLLWRFFSYTGIKELIDVDVVNVAVLWLDCVEPCDFVLEVISYSRRVLAVRQRSIARSSFKLSFELSHLLLSGVKQYNMTVL